MVRFAIAPQPPSAPHSEPYAAQLALSRIHSHLVPLLGVRDGYVIDHANNHGLIELPAGRGLAGYGLARALRLLLDVLAGLSSLHDTQTERGEPFTHGELAPASIRVDSSGAARLIPLAAWHWSPLGGQPSPERMGHLAPERLLGDPIDQRADVFSAGVLLWEAIAGRRLFDGAAGDEIIMRLLGGRVTLPALPPEISWALPLADVAMRALAVDPERRFGSVAAFAEAIETIAAGHVASHANVAAYFGASDPHARGSSSEHPSEARTHNSSLSALVSPTRSAFASVASSARQHEAGASNPRSRAALWVGAAGLSLLVAVGVGVARRGAERGPAPLASTLTVAAPLQGQPLARASSVSEVPPAPSSTIRVTPLSSGAAPPASAELHAAPLRSRPRTTKPVTVHKVSSAPLKAAPKPLLTRDRDADQYGI